MRISLLHECCCIGHLLWIRGHNTIDSREEPCPPSSDTPVLVAEEEKVLAGSDDIIQYLRTKVHTFLDVR